MALSKNSIQISNYSIPICSVKHRAFNSTTVGMLPCTVSTHICLSKNLAAHFKVLQPYQVNYREQWVGTVEKLLPEKKSLWYVTQLKLLQITNRNSSGVQFIICFPKFILRISTTSNGMKVYKFEIIFFFVSHHHIWN